MVTIDGLPVYNALIDAEDEGMYCISLVDDPAVQSNFLAFSATRKEEMLFAIQNEEKRLVNGVVMRADYPIYRRDQMGEYYIVYKADVIRKMAEKYLANGWQNEVDTMHNGELEKDVQMVQFFIKDSSRGVSPEGFENVADGSLFAEFHVLNDEVWNAVKDGTFKGFSLAGLFSFEEETEVNIVEEIVSALEALDEKFFKQKTMTKRERIMERLAQMLVKLGSMTTDKGILVWDGDADLAVGDAVQIQNEDESLVAAPDGDYVVEDGTIYRVADGKVVEIIEPEEAQEEPVAEVEGEGEEPMPEAEPMPEEPDRMAMMEQKVAELEERVKALEEMFNAQGAVIEEMKKTPMANPAHEEVRENTVLDGKSTNKRIENLKRILNA